MEVLCTDVTDGRDMLSALKAVTEAIRAGSVTDMSDIAVANAVAVSSRQLRSSTRVRG